MVYMQQRTLALSLLMATVVWGAPLLQTQTQTTTATTTATKPANPTKWRAFQVGGDCSKGCSVAFAMLAARLPGRPWPPVHLVQIARNSRASLVPAVDYVLEPVQSGPDLVIDFKIPILRHDVIYLVYEIIYPPGNGGAK